MIQHHSTTLALRLPENAKAFVPDLITAHLSGDPDEIEKRRRQYRFALIFAREKEERKRREREHYQELLREDRERNLDRVEDRFLGDERDLIDSFESLPVGTVSMRRHIRLKREEPFYWEGFDRANWNKRNCGRKPRRIR